MPANEFADDTVLARFLRYAAFDTQSDPESTAAPSAAKEFALAAELLEELRGLGLEAFLTDTGIVYGSIPATTGLEDRPAIGMIAHMDTSPDAPGAGVTPQIIRVTGGDIVLNTEKNIVFSVAQFPEILRYTGEDVVFTDGTTLLGADDKAGIAAIMTMAAHLVRNPDIPHARIAIAFTPDEEIGRGTENFDIARFGAAYACTFDGGELGELESENFNAASATLTVTGVGVHPGAAKNKMVNAARIAANFAARLPVDLAPETTEGREGFLHPHEISGSVTDARVVILIRDHDKTLFEAKKTFLRDLAAEFAAENPRAGIRLEITDSYENMRPYVERTPAVMALVREAFADAGVTPVELPIRGGTDGAMLSVRGLPCPNIFTGGLNYHGVYECLPVRSLEKAAEVAVALARRSKASFDFQTASPP